MGAHHWKAGLVASLVVGCVTLSWVGAARAGHSLRCGRRLVGVGASMYKVRKTCGEPQDAIRRTEWRRTRRLIRVPCSPNSEAMCTRSVGEFAEVQVEEWIYDVGRTRFLRHVTFEQGRVVDIKTGDYGG